MFLQQLFQRFQSAKKASTDARMLREQVLLQHVECLTVELEASRAEVNAVTEAAQVLRPGMTHAEALAALSGNAHPQVEGMISRLFPPPGASA